METFSLVSAIASIVSVVTVFLFAIEKFSEEIKIIEGKRMKDLIIRSSDKPWKGVISGFFATSILQSSTAVSVILVSLAHARLIPFTSSLAILLGSNIGTAITTQLVAFKVLNMAPYILIIGFILMKIQHKMEHYGKAIFYFGLIFSCLLIFSVITSSLRENHIILSLLDHTSNVYIGILVGFVVANILQSSTATISILIILASQGIVNLDQALGIVLGANIGTTTTALFASIVTNREGKKVAFAHFITKLIGAILFIPFISFSMNFISQFSIDLGQKVGLIHIVFNVFVTIVFLLFFNQANKLILKLFNFFYRKKSVIVE